MKVGAAVGFQVKGVVVVVVVVVSGVVVVVVVVVIVGLLVGLAIVASAVGVGVTTPWLLVGLSLLSISLTASAIPPKFN